MRGMKKYHEKEFVSEIERLFEMLILSPEMMNGAFGNRKGKQTWPKLDKYIKCNQTVREVKEATLPMSSHYYDKIILDNFLTLETTE